jgi:uncharacterized protein (TIGR00369 family)
MLARVSTLGPAHRLLGLELLERSSEHATFSMQPRPELLQETGILHGGILAALADAAAVYVLLPDLPATKSVTSIELKINFLRPATLEAGPLHAVARLVRRGGTVALCHVELTQNDRPIAVALSTYAFLDVEERRNDPQRSAAER